MEVDTLDKSTNFSLHTTEVYSFQFWIGTNSTNHPEGIAKPLLNGCHGQWSGVAFFILLAIVELLKVSITVKVLP